MARREPANFGSSLPPPERATLLESLTEVVNQLGWLSDTAQSTQPQYTANEPVLPTSQQSPLHAPDECLFRGLRNSAEIFPLNPFGQRQLDLLLARGLTLRHQWRGWQTAVDQWLGPRLYFGHARMVNSQHAFAAVCSSRIGRHGQQLSQWPELLDWFLRDCKRHRRTLLQVPGTTMFETLTTYATIADLERATVLVGSEKHTLVQWLVLCLTMDTDSDSLRTLHVSVPLGARAARGAIGRADATEADRGGELQSTEPQAVGPQAISLQTTPLQDRLAFALANSVYTLSARSGGTVARLLAARLADKRFPSGSCFVARPSANNIDRGKVDSRKASAADWLDCGAVGVYLPKNMPPIDNKFAHCESSDYGGKTPPHVLHSLAAPMPKYWKDLSEGDWCYLAHCTRGQIGPAPQECSDVYRLRVWQAGLGGSDPFRTLNKIVSERRLLATAGITRTDQHCVSFSAVPLPELLSRRTFRSHLGRWDWEPYGILIRLPSMEALGARPVIYATESEFAKLPCEDQAYFQPIPEAPSERPKQAGAGQRKARSKSTKDWSAEREWRVLDDLRLSRFRPEDVLVFVASRRQAIRLARFSPWTVLWVDEREDDAASTHGGK